MPRICLSTLFLLTLLTLAYSQSCLNHAGQSVSWFVMIISPKTTTQFSYLYFDSTFNSPNSTFTIQTLSPSSPLSPLGLTLTQINTLSLSTIAWNDDKPNGSTSSTSAHSKTVVASSYSTNLGFIVDHSIPEYPAFSNNVVNITIGDSQQIYGQHVFCMSLGNEDIEGIVGNLRIIKPYIFQANIPNNLFPNMYAMSNSLFISTPSNFQYYSFTSGSFNFKSIYKNGNNSKNCSIFQDGLNNYLQDGLIAETWGRPLDAAWCGIPRVRNVREIKVQGLGGWTETKDHAKWVIAENKYWSCFGDMNRMKSQWKRGGAFYCVESEGLRRALGGIVLTDQC